MLSACLDARDIGSPWRSDSSGWAAGGSTIHPYSHAALAAELRYSERRVAVVIRERICGAPGCERSTAHCSDGAIDRWLKEARSWPLDFISLVLTNAADGPSVEINAGSWGTAPVYLHVRDNVLRIDWDAARLYPYLGSIVLDRPIAATVLLALGQRYSHRTIFPEIAMLTERATALWQPPHNAVRVTYPPPYARAAESRLRAGVNVARTFREILLASMRRWRASESDPVAVELSGGLDSSVVASGVAQLPAPAAHAYGMIVPGMAAVYQRVRRNEVVHRMGLRDRNFACAEHPPFGQGDPQSVEGFVPWEEFYSAAIAHMLTLAREDGISMIYTGVGGDELCSLYTGEPDVNADIDPSACPQFIRETVIDAFVTDALRERAPKALAYTSVLESGAAGARVYLRNGVWPANPLATPELVEFSRRLPLRWRRDRRLSRAVLKSFGYSRRVTHPRREHLEDFLGLMDYGLHEAASLCDRLFADSRLEAQGLIDSRAFLDAYRDYRNGNLSRRDQVLGALVLELTVRSAENARRLRL